jgi:hypothetical protein
MKNPMADLQPNDLITVRLNSGSYKGKIISVRNKGKYEIEIEGHESFKRIVVPERLLTKREQDPAIKKLLDENREAYKQLGKMNG